MISATFLFRQSSDWLTRSTPQHGWCKQTKTPHRLMFGFVNYYFHFSCPIPQSMQTNILQSLDVIRAIGPLPGVPLVMTCVVASLDIDGAVYLWNGSVDAVPQQPTLQCHNTACSTSATIALAKDGSFGLSLRVGTTRITIDISTSCKLLFLQSGIDSGFFFFCSWILLCF